MIICNRRIDLLAFAIFFVFYLFLLASPQVFGFEAHHIMFFMLLALAFTVYVWILRSTSNVCEFIESPYSGNVDGNIRYLILCGIDSFARGKMPTSTHGSMTMHPACQGFFVSDYDSKWKIFGRHEVIDRGQALRRKCARTVFYTDLGWSRGMKAARDYCDANALTYVERRLDVDLVMNMVAAEPDRADTRFRGESVHRRRVRKYAGQLRPNSRRCGLN